MYTFILQYIMMYYKMYLILCSSLHVQYNPVYDVAVSSDKAGMVEYWSGQELGFKFPSKQLKFEYKTDTDLFEFVKVSSLID